MAWTLLPLGIVVLVVTIADLFATVAQPGRQGGFVATRAADLMWRGALAIHERWPSHRRLAAAGVTCVAAVPVSWMTAMWAGWSLVFASSEHAVIDARTDEPAGTTARIYFAGYSLFTSGIGDKLPGGPAWEIATVLATAMGLGLVTLAITYLVPVVQAATARRAVAREVTRLGGTPESIVARCWRPPAVTVLADAAADLRPRVELLTEQHLTFPVLHYLHSVDVDTAFAPRMAALHESMVLASSSDVSDDDQLRFDLLREAIDDLAATFPAGGDARDGAGDGAGDVAIDDTSLDDRSAVRRRLRELVRRDGWNWTTVEPS